MNDGDKSCATDFVLAASRVSRIDAARSAKSATHVGEIAIRTERKA